MYAPTKRSSSPSPSASKKTAPADQPSIRGRVRRPRERPVAAVDVEDVPAEVRDEEVGIAVAIDVADRDAAPPAVVADAGRLGHVLERAVALVAVERVLPLLDDLPAVEPPAVDDVEVEVAVAVVVEKREAAAARLEEMGLLLPPAPDDGRDGLLREVEGRGRGGGRPRGRFLAPAPPPDQQREERALHSLSNAFATSSK